MTTDAIGLYLHIPFCLQKCNYCDFSSFAGVSTQIREKYIECLITELYSYRKDKRIKIDSIFFGGGTPSLLCAREFSKLAEAIHNSFEVLPNTEFSIEANPKTLTEENLCEYIANGVNRVSLGMQSIHENELKFLGRIHSFDDIIASVRLFDKLGIDNFNLDLMYAIPDQTVSSFSKTLDAAIAMGAAHISAYGLIIEEGTDFYRRKESLPLPSEDEECAMYSIACERLFAAGFSHYEISNYARLGYSCRHNLKYWQDGEYIGVGLGAHSYFGNKRYANSDIFSEYLSQDFTKYRTEETISLKDSAYEYAMLRLRLAEGFSLSEYERLFGKSFLFGKGDVIKTFVREGLLSLLNGRIFFTEKGFYLSNSLLTELL